MDANTRIVQGLSRVVDEHIQWLAVWHQIAFYGGPERAARANEIKTPLAFMQWHERAIMALPAQQPIMDRLLDLHNQLHTAAKMVILKASDGEALPINDYEKVLSRFDEFVTTVRRLERAFTESEAGLDPLTGLRTRMGLKEDFNREMNRFKNAGTPFVFVAMDLDHFKKVNDSFGHDMGDRTLVSVSNMLLRQIRTYDDAYRMGGEEFLIILKGLDTVTATPVIERLRAAISRIDLKSPDGAAMPITASFGYCSVASDLTCEDMLQKADAALYRAKREGRNRIIKA